MRAIACLVVLLASSLLPTALLLPTRPSSAGRAAPHGNSAALPSRSRPTPGAAAVPLFQQAREGLLPEAHLRSSSLRTARQRWAQIPLARLTPGKQSAAKQTGGWYKRPPEIPIAKPNAPPDAAYTSPSMLALAGSAKSTSSPPPPPSVGRDAAPAVQSRSAARAVALMHAQETLGVRRSTPAWGSTPWWRTRGRGAGSTGSSGAGPIPTPATGLDKTRPTRRLPTGASMPKHTPVSDKVTVFLHFHKSGGTTVCDMARKQPSVHMSQFQLTYNCNAKGEDVQTKNVWWKPNLVTCDKVKQYNKEYKSDFMMIETMLHEGIRHCPTVTYMTTVREPMERLLSHLDFEKISLRSALALATGQREESAQNIFLHRAQFDNFYVRTLLGEKVFHLPVGQITATHLAEAKEVLETFALVIPVPRMTSDIHKVIEQVLGWKFRVKGLQHNKAKAPHTQERVQAFAQAYPKQFEQLVHINRLDVELFEWIVAKFDEKWIHIMPNPPPLDVYTRVHKYKD